MSEDTNTQGSFKLFSNCYSLNDEDFSYETMEEVAQEVWSRGTCKVGDVLTIYEGDASVPSASEFLGNVAEDLCSRAYDEFGDVAEEWDFTNDQKEDLQKIISEAVDKWADANNVQPSFWSVDKSKETEIRFVDDTGRFEVTAKGAVKLMIGTDTNQNTVAQEHPHLTRSEISRELTRQAVERCPVCDLWNRTSILDEGSRCESCRVA